MYKKLVKFYCMYVCLLILSEEEDGKGDDAQSVVSGGEEYEPISDDELDEILADSQKRDDQQDEEKISGTYHHLEQGPVKTHSNHKRTACLSLICPPQFHNEPKIFLHFT